MYSIGEFSKIGSVSTKTLRYYDEIGLLHPAYVEEDNRYRFYSEEQVDEILYINELKNYDLRLEQIKAIMESHGDALLEHFLQERREQINSRIQEDIQLRKSIEKKISEIQSGGIKMKYRKNLEVEAKVFERSWVMSKTDAIEISEIGVVIGKVFELIFSQGLQPAGPVMTIYLDEEFHGEHANVEVCVPIADGERVKNVPGMKLFNPGLCATCTYLGAYSQLGKAYAAVLKWIEENQYQLSSATFDCYLNNPMDIRTDEELMTQVWFPIKEK